MVIPSNCITSSVSREMIPAVIEVRTTADRNRANPIPAGNPISAAGSPWRALVPDQSIDDKYGP